MRLLLDADIYRYQHGSIQMAHPFLKGEFVPASADYVRQIVDEAIEHAVKSTGADDYICVLSGKGNFRHEVAKQQEYKGNRDPNSSRPYHYDTIADHIIGNHPHIVVDGMEADDWLAITQRADPENTCISTRDKDMLTVFGYHHRPACGIKQPEIPKHWVTPYDAAYFFMYQMLIGDNTDNIPGCGKKELVMWGGKQMLRRKGVGSKGAHKILSLCGTVGEMYDAVSEEYKKIFGDEYIPVMLENARLLYVGQTPDNLFEWDWLDFSLSNTNNKSQNNNEVEKDMNLYEVTLFNPSAEEAATAMVNVEAVKLAQDMGAHVAIHMGGDVVLHVEKNSFMAAMSATSSGFFKMEKPKTDEAEEPKAEAEVEPTAE